MQFPEYNIPYENFGETVERRKDKRGRDYLFVSNRHHADMTEGQWDGFWTSATILPNPTTGVTIFVWYSQEYTVAGEDFPYKSGVKIRRWCTRYVITSRDGWHIGPNIGLKQLDQWRWLAKDELGVTYASVWDDRIDVNAKLNGEDEEDLGINWDDEPPF